MGLKDLKRNYIVKINKEENLFFSSFLYGFKRMRLVILLFPLPYKNEDYDTI